MLFRSTIAGALRNLDYDLIITGRQAIDGDTAQVGPQIAEHLGLPVISYAADIKVDGDSVIVKRQYEDRYHELKAKMPCLVTALSELNQPRYMTPGGIFDACDKEVTVWGRADLKDVDDSDLGLKGPHRYNYRSNFYSLPNFSHAFLIASIGFMECNSVCNYNLAYPCSTRITSSRSFIFVS